MLSGVLAIRSATSGCFAQKADSRGISHRVVNDGGAVMRKVRSTIGFIFPSPTLNASKPSRILGSNFWPYSVSSSARVCRTNSGTSSRSSSNLICWLIAAGVTFSSSAAFLKLRCRPAASKARSATRGGSVSCITINLILSDSLETFNLRHDE